MLSCLGDYALSLVVILVVAAALPGALAAAPIPPTDPYRAIREEMVEQRIEGAGVKNRRVLAAMRITPRHRFVPNQQELLAQVYQDRALPIGAGQTISPPFIVATMTAALDPQPKDKVLEIGTGSGYQAAVLSPLVETVYTIEIAPQLARQARDQLQQLGYRNVHCKTGDGYRGWPEHAPFDKIIVTCSPKSIPAPMVEQLAEGGRLIIPLGKRFQQSLLLFHKVNGKLERQWLGATFFVPMTGKAETERRHPVDETFPSLVGGGFEMLAPDQTKPLGWYYVRQASVCSPSSVPAGKRCLTFHNRSGNGSAQALQAIGVDGRQVRHLKLSCQVHGETISPGPHGGQQSHLMIEFYNARRISIGQAHVGPWSGTFTWQLVEKVIPVPRTARLAVVGIGLFGATGKVSFDQIEITPHPIPADS